MKPLSKGDPCRVRLHTGEVVDAVYECESEAGGKTHLVRLNNKYWCDRVMGSICTKDVSIGRFVGPACDHVDIVPVGVSV